jgi:hypothetical protein
MPVAVLLFTVKITVKQGEPDKKGQTYQILYPLDVLVIIYQCKNFLYLSN